jgi:hypothetical protein
VDSDRTLEVEAFEKDDDKSKDKPEIKAKPTENKTEAAKVEKKVEKKGDDVVKTKDSKVYLIQGKDKPKTAHPAPKEPHITPPSKVVKGDNMITPTPTKEKSQTDVVETPSKTTDTPARGIQQSSLGMFKVPHHDVPSNPFAQLV